VSRAPGSAGRETFDLLVIGSGIAGLAVAITAAERGLSVAVVSKQDALEDTNTRRAQGGIVGRGDGDTAELLVRDILEAGDHVNSIAATTLLAAEGPDLVDRFLAQKIGVPFSRTPSGGLDLTMEAAHSVRRIYHAMDQTGQAIETALLAYLTHVPEVRTFPDHTTIDLITNTHNSIDPQEKYRETRVLGAYVLDGASGTVRILFAPAVVLATGGVGNLFLHTSNPEGATGDGVAMAHRMGADVINAEYVQFHPTVLYHRDRKRFLISESLRGEGARLINRSDEHFMDRHAPGEGDLASRDKVARAIYSEMESESSEYVRLDARQIRGIALEERFPAIFSTCRELGIDIRKEPIPVVPAAHYFCGGIKVDLDGRTSVPGLYAVGECACTGVHGANRLASVSLLEGLYWGVRVGQRAFPGEVPPSLRQGIPDWVPPKDEEVFDPVLVSQDFRTIQSTMWNYAGIVRTTKRLLRAQADLSYLEHRIERFYREAKLTREIVELRNAVIAAELIVRAALTNGTSRGCHYLE
jgi:L-aspartate oxidase